MPVLCSAIWSFPSTSRFEPFVGAGFGAVYMQVADDRGEDACLAFKGGLRYALDGRVSIGADYTFFMLGFLSAFLGEAVGDDTVNLGVHWHR